MTRLAVAVAIRSGVPPAYWLEHLDELVTAYDLIRTETADDDE